MQEIWKDIEGYEGHYKVSNTGKIKSLERNVNHSYSGTIRKKERILKIKINQNGYANVCLCLNGISNYQRIHRLVAYAFLKNKNNKREVNHIDGNKLNNNINNLEWCTRSENLKHAFATGLHINKSSKKVNQYSKNGKFIKTHKSMKAAYRELGKIDNGYISKCCRGLAKTVHGFKWEYANE